MAELAFKNKHRNQRCNKAPVDLVSHHSLCELNFHYMLRLMPGLRNGRDVWKITVGVDQDIHAVIEVIETAPYTTTLCVSQELYGVCSSCIRVRLYHDVEMAEIIAWDNHRNWRTHYDYPNRNMYQPDEKFALNRFLNDWLLFCSREGEAGRYICDLVLVNKK